MTPNPFPRPTLPDSQETQSDRETKQTNAFGEETRVGGYNQTTDDQYPVEGTVLSNRYRLIKKIGQGGMAQVYKAQDKQNNDKYVAVKVLLPQLQEDERAVEKLKKEANTARDLQHHNLLNVYGFEISDNWTYLLSEWVDGENLSEKLSNAEKKGVNGLEWREIKPWLLQIADGLDFIHINHCIHRDIKPNNIMITNKGTPILLDFGISYQANQTLSKYSKGNAVSGTPGYIPPEAHLGGYNFDPKYDVYGLAVTIYRLLTNDEPYKGALCASRDTTTPKPKRPDSLSAAQWKVLFDAFYYAF